MAIDGIKMLRSNHQVFDDLTDRRYVETELDVISMVVTYDSKNLVALCSSVSDSFEVHGYSLSTFKRTFNLAFNGEF